MTLRHSFFTLAASLAVAAAVCRSVGYFGPPDIVAAHALVGAAVALLACRSETSRAGRGHLLSCLAAGGVLLALEPTRAAGVWIAAGAALAAVAGSRPRLAAVGEAGIRGGGLWLLGLGALPLWERIEAYEPSLAAVAAAVAAVIEIAGGEAAAHAGVVTVDMGWGTTALQLDPLKAGGLLAALVLAFDSLMALDRSGPRRAAARAARVGLLLAAFVVLRLVVIVLLAPLAPTMLWLIEPVFVFVSFLPFALLAPLALPRTAAPASPAAAAPTRARRLAPAAALAAGLALVVAGLAWYPAGDPRSGTVLLDESHSAWESAATPFDREHWGRGSTYNYAGLADLLRRHFDFSIHGSGEITPEVLRGVQVLVLKTPTSAYSDREVEAILAHVAAGGGVWLVGDHTNLYGMSDTLNRIAVPAGMRFMPDATYDVKTGWTTKNRLRWPVHPAAAASGGFEFQTSCSIAALRPGVEPVLIGYRLTAESADYGHPNFFGNMETELEDRVGTLLQGAAARYGRGRVVCFSDSTVLSNFSLFEPGISEMVLGTVTWLSSSGGLPRGWREALVALGAAALGLGLVGLRRLHGRLPLALLPGAAAAAVGAAALVDSASEPLVPPAIRDPYQVVAFVEDASSFHMTSFIEEAQNTYLGGPDAKASSLSTFYTWMLRLDGTRPRLDPDLETSVQRGASLIVIFEPRRAPTSEEEEWLRRFMVRGGRLLVIDDIQNRRRSRASEWLTRYGLGVEVASRPRSFHRPQAHRGLEATAALSAAAACEIVADAALTSRPEPGEILAATVAPDRLVATGGTPWLVDESGAVTGTWKSIGAGLVSSLTVGSALTNEVLGGRYEVAPSDETLEHHLAVLDLIGRVLGLGRDGKEEPQ